MAKFRLQDLKIWQLAIDIADQLRGSRTSMTNNIAEGSGSSSRKEFKRYLYVSKINI